MKLECQEIKETQTETKQEYYGEKPETYVPLWSIVLLISLLIIAFVVWWNNY